MADEKLFKAFLELDDVGVARVKKAFGAYWGMGRDATLDEVWAEIRDSYLAGIVRGQEERIAAAAIPAVEPLPKDTKAADDLAAAVAAAVEPKP